MPFINKIPFIRYFFPFLTGILIYLFSSTQVNFYLVCVFYSLLLLIYYFNIDKSNSLKKKTFGICLNLFFLLVGILSCNVYKYNHPNHYTNFIAHNPNVLYARVADIPKQTNKSVKIQLDVKSLIINGENKNTCGKIICYLQRNDTTTQIKYGDLLALSSPKFNSIKANLNPNEFDYKDYLSNSNVYYQVFIKSNNLKNLGYVNDNLIIDYSLYLKQKFISILKNNGVTGQELEVTSAILLGYDDNIDPELMKAYGHTGTLHVLSVSGLHVGVIYLILNYIFFFLNKNRKQVFLKVIIIFLFLWFYAFLSGLSPSVVRASAMFSVVMFGNAFNKKSEVFNSIFVTAFFILLFNPYLIKDLGFQLSYLSLIGIIYFQPKIYQWLNFENHYADKLWQFCSVSIAAQLITLPISIYYFHQIPLLFLISNLIIIPISSVLMYLGILVLALSFMPQVCSLLVYLLSFACKSMNYLTIQLDQVPYSYIGNIAISLAMVYLLYCIILLFFKALENKSIKYVYATFVFIIISVCLSIYNEYANSKYNKLIIYNLNNFSVIDMIESKNNTSLCDTLSYERLKAINFHVEQNRIQENIKSTAHIPLGTKDLIINFKNKKLLIKNDSLLSNPREKIDYLLIRKNNITSLNDLYALYSPNLIIADGSNSYKTLKKIKKEASKLKIDLWVTKEKGALTIQ